MQSHAEVPVADLSGVAGVHSHPHPHQPTLGPRMGGQAPLRVPRRRDRVTGRRERGKHGIALSLEDHPTVLLNRRLQDVAVSLHQCVVTNLKRVEKPSRSLHVREQERDRARGEVHVTLTGARTRVGCRQGRGRRSRTRSVCRRSA